MIAVVVLVRATPASCWDAKTHQLITRLAIFALPKGPLKTQFEAEGIQLEEFSVEPDTVLRPMYGQAEGCRHYIDLENFGSDPFARLSPDFTTMERAYGSRLLDRSGTLPWAIEDEAQKMRSSWQASDCAEMLRHAGYLAHYVGDASQPLHTTRFYDGVTREDRGEHARLESTADSRVYELEDLARNQAHAQQIDSVWAAVVPEIKQSNAWVSAIASNDRTARLASGDERSAYQAALMRSEESMIVHQVVDGATTLSSVWLFEWQQTGETNSCLGTRTSPPRAD